MINIKRKAPNLPSYLENPEIIRYRFVEDNYNIELIDAKTYTGRLTVTKENSERMKDPKFLTILKRDLMIKFLDNFNIEDGCYFQYEINEDCYVKGTTELILKCFRCKKNGFYDN